jgi:light-harvesting complex I chlorophyll a/b binding protein 1|uniref:Plastid light harvesting protein n=2 Tax=Ditylum brightwellii TaxID=49249 RepID=A0A6U3P341_9STRA
MKLALLASLFGAAAAFAPSTSQGARSLTALNEKSTALPFLEYPENLKGYVGDVGFDPFRFSDFVPMDFLREAELKHGRICMLAWTGFVAVDLGFRIFPLPEAYEGLTSVTAHDALVKQGAMGQLFLWMSVAEVISSVAVMQMLNEGSGRKPGDFGLDPVGFLKGKSEAEIEEMELKEITHCRLAMMAFSGVVTQAVLTQGPFPYV